MHTKFIFALCLVGLAVLFIVQNVAVVEIQFLLWSISMSRSLLMFLLLAIGILAGWLLHSYIAHRRRK